MTLHSTKTKEIYKGNGSTSVFPVPYLYSKTDTITLVFTDAAGKDTLVRSNYRIDVSASGNTTVVYPVAGKAIPAGTKLTVYRDTPLTQLVDLIDGGAFNPDVLEHDGFDRLVMMIQELQEEVDRAVKASISNGSKPVTMDEMYADLQTFAEAAAGSAGKSEASAQRSEASAVQAKKSAAEAAISQAVAAAECDRQVQRVVEAGNGQSSRIKNEGTGYVNSASRAADRAEQAAASIPGFAGGRHRFAGLKMSPDTTSLMLTLLENGDSFRAEDFDTWGIVPAEAGFSVRDGSLCLELLFQEQP